MIKIIDKVVILHSLIHSSINSPIFGGKRNSQSPHLDRNFYLLTISTYPDVLYIGLSHVIVGSKFIG